MINFLKWTIQIICAVIFAIICIMIIVFIIRPLEWIEEKMTAEKQKRPVR